MIILPAIDIKDGQCVRLLKGDFATTEKVAEDAVETALDFKAAGAQFIHTVDLDGALQGRPVNNKVFENIVNATDLKIEVGGGIRNMETVESYLNSGVERVILGSAALSNPAFTEAAVKEFGEHIAVGIDAKNRMVCADGWLESSSVDFVTLAKQMEQIGVRTLIFTDISKDGTLAGPNLEQLDEISNAVSCDIVASGGVANISDIIALKKMGLYGAIVGKAIYSGSLDLAEAIREAL